VPSFILFIGSGSFNKYFINKIKDNEMKNLILFLAFFAVILVAGCSENSVTDPVWVDTANKDQNRDISNNQGTIPLKDILVFPGSFTSYYYVEGNIYFKQELILAETVPPRYYVSLDIAIKAILSNIDLPDEKGWEITGESKDVFYVSEDGIYLLEKSFPVSNRRDGMKLVCRFLVTTDGVGLNSVSLAVTEEDGIHAINKNLLPVDTVTFPPVRSLVSQ
jgi:hypothetical protein